MTIFRQRFSLQIEKETNSLTFDIFYVFYSITKDEMSINLWKKNSRKQASNFSIFECQTKELNLFCWIKIRKWIKTKLYWHFSSTLSNWIILLDVWTGLNEVSKKNYNKFRKKAFNVSNQKQFLLCTQFPRASLIRLKSYLFLYWYPIHFVANNNWKKHEKK